MSSDYTLLRRLTGSELGWFAAPRKAGRAKGRQRGINFNAIDVARLFAPEFVATGDIPLISSRVSDGQTQRRRIKLQEKNWRLVGDMVSGEGLDALREGDFFWATVDTAGSPPYQLSWDVVTASGNPDLHEQISREFNVLLKGGMASWPPGEPLAAYFAKLVGVDVGPSDQDRAEMEPRKDYGAKPTSPGERPKAKSRPFPAQPDVVPKRRKRLDDRLRRPHILAQIVKTGMALSAKAQADFIDVLDDLADELRQLFLDGDLIRSVKINQQDAWADLRGTAIGFVDGGVANVDALGAAPLAIRVGSYVVTPGQSGPSREAFDFEVQLVDELYDSSPGSGIFSDWFEDTAKLRDAARICCETAGLLALTLRDNAPKIAVLHGPLVNPVSPYALGEPSKPDAFPNFTAETLGKLLPSEKTRRTGRAANFVSVYLEQLTKLAAGEATVCGVVERPSHGSPLIAKLLEELCTTGSIDNDTKEKFLEKLQAYRITDSVIFECVLNEGEYVRETEVDKQGPGNKIPVLWAPEIGAYPRPFVTYVKSGAEVMPVRVESFRTGPLSQARLMSLIVHTSRLLPRYAFPVGLDIVDKHAKVPEWMSRQMGAMLSAQLMKKAMEAGNPAAIKLVKRMLSTNTRDWLFRPDFRRP